MLFTFGVENSEKWHKLYRKLLFEQISLKMVGTRSLPSLKNSAFNFPTSFQFANKKSCKWQSKALDKSTALSRTDFHFSSIFKRQYCVMSFYETALVFGSKVIDIMRYLTKHIFFKKFLYVWQYTYGSVIIFWVYFSCLKYSSYIHLFESCWKIALSITSLKVEHVQ